MVALAEKALMRGRAKKTVALVVDVDPFGDALRESFDAVKAGDYDAYRTAIESAITIKMAGSPGDEDEDEDEDDSGFGLRFA